ncbi:MAG: lipid hydroperoxide peroxidase [Planctomycetes bacterium]|nr:lipid hydroperoxide peroxidase [Planctomycetota bacterium]
MAQITLKGNPINTCGTLPAVGSAAPDFVLTKSDLSNVSLADFAGRTKILNIVPSLDTPVCQVSMRTFNEKAASLTNAVVLTVSRDLPFAMNRFCETEGIETAIPLSEMGNRDFGAAYGMEITDGPLAGVLGRAIVVIDGGGKVTHNELVPEIAQEPDYDAALAAANG